MYRIYSSDANIISKSGTRIPIDDAIATLECVLRCGSHTLHGICRRVVYEIASASTDSFIAHEAKLDEVLRVHGPDGTSTRYLSGLLALREDHCIKRWIQYMGAPQPEYSALCTHIPGGLIATDAQVVEKVKRWDEARHEIELSFRDEECDWSNDPLRALHKIRTRRHIRPEGWKECPGDHCKALIKEAWNRRIEREWADFQERLMVCLPFLFSADERMEVGA